MEEPGNSIGFAWQQFQRSHLRTQAGQLCLQATASLQTPNFVNTPNTDYALWDRVSPVSTTQGTIVIGNTNTVAQSKPEVYLRLILWWILTYARLCNVTSLSTPKFTCIKSIETWRHKTEVKRRNAQIRHCDSEITASNFVTVTQPQVTNLSPDVPVQTLFTTRYPAE